MKIIRLLPLIHRTRLEPTAVYLQSIMSFFRAVIEKVRFFFAVSSFLISVQPVLTNDSELAAVSLTLPMRSIRCVLRSFMVSSYMRAVSAAFACSRMTSLSW